MEGSDEVGKWSEEVEDLVAAGDTDKAISLLRSVVSKLETLTSADSDLRLASALTELASLYSSQGFSLKADAILDRVSLIKQRANRVVPSCDEVATSRAVEEGRISDDENFEKSVKSSDAALPRDGSLDDEMASNNNILLRSFLDKEKLTGINFHDWYHNLRIVLKQQKLLEVLDAPLPPPPPATATKADLDAYKKQVESDLNVSCLMLATMSSVLQMKLEKMNAFEMITHLKQLYRGQARFDRILTSRELFSCKMSEGESVGPHVLKMIGYIEKLATLEYPLCQELATDLILQSLPESYNHFVINFIVSEIEVPPLELLNMLRTAEKNSVKPKTFVMVNTKDKRKSRKGKRGKHSSSKPQGGVQKGKKDNEKCFHCNKNGH